MTTTPPIFTQAHQLGSDSGARYLLALANEAQPGTAMPVFEAISEPQVLAALVRAALCNGYDQWVTAKPAGQSAQPVVHDTSKEALTAEMLEASLASFFDVMVQSQWDVKDLVWFARHVPDDESPQAHEWGIWPGLVGIALPDALSLKLAAAAEQRLASQADQERQAPAP